MTIDVNWNKLQAHFSFPKGHFDLPASTVSSINITTHTLQYLKNPLRLHLWRVKWNQGRMNILEVTHFTPAYVSPVRWKQLALSSRMDFTFLWLLLDKWMSFSELHLSSLVVPPLASITACNCRVRDFPVFIMTKLFQFCEILSGLEAVMAAPN